MNNGEIVKLRAYCSNLAKVLNTEVNYEGTNLHDIKNSFDYVIKSMRETWKLDDTDFAKTAIEKAEAAGEVLSKLWQAINTLVGDILKYCDNQYEYNSYKVR